MDRHARADRFVLHGADQLQAGPVADMVQSAVLVPAERPLSDFAFRRAVEYRAVLLQFQNALRRFPREDFCGAPVVQKAAALHVKKI